MVTIEFMEAFEKHFYRSGKTSLATADIKLEPHIISFPMTPFNPYFEEFSDKIQRLIESGICPERLAGRTSTSMLRNKLYDETVPALVLSMDDLGIGFEICLILLVLSVATFILEVIFSKIKQTVKEYLTVLYAVKSFIGVGPKAM